MPTLHESLSYQPVELQFGTSGRRGQVVHLTQLEIFINAVAELEFLQALPAGEGGVRRGDEFYFARDLRPSSDRYVAAQEGRGELAQAVEAAIGYCGMTPVNEGQIPTPALMSYAVARNRGSIMVTGSHIPFDRNGYKTNTARGELLKRHEAPVNDKVREVRERFYRQPFADSPFGADGLLKGGSRRLSPARDDAARHYLRRYTDFFDANALHGLKLLVYQHSAVGRDLLTDILQALGAQVTAAGRSDAFVPIDTENMDAAQLSAVQALYNDAAAAHGPFDAVVSTDGDSDRPMLLGIEPGASNIRFFAGDLVGMVTAEFLGADAVVAPISCNDSIDRGPLAAMLEPKTRIGSPWVIAGMEDALAAGKRRVCGFEANGGFLTGSDISRHGKILPALPTRDAVLPILSVLSLAHGGRLPLAAVFDRLPRRFSRAALLKDFPRTRGLALVKRLSPDTPAVAFVEFDGGAAPVMKTASGQRVQADEDRLAAARQVLTSVFSKEAGFGAIEKINYIDGVRIYFKGGDIAHLRPSGNADEFRIYAVSDSQARADEIAAMSVGEPEGLLRKLASLSAAG